MRFWQTKATQGRHANFLQYFRNFFAKYMFLALYKTGYKIFEKFQLSEVRFWQTKATQGRHTNFLQNFRNFFAKYMFLPLDKIAFKIFETFQVSDIQPCVIMIDS